MSSDECAEVGCGHADEDHRPARVNSIPTTWCHACAKAVPRWAVQKLGESAYDHCEHSFKPTTEASASAGEQS